MGVVGGLLILVGIGGIGLGFGVGDQFGSAGLEIGFGLMVMGCVLVGLNRIYRAVRSSTTEIKALRLLLAEQFEARWEPDRVAPSIPWSPRMPPDWRQGAGA